MADILAPWPQSFSMIMLIQGGVHLIQCDLPRTNVDASPIAWSSLRSPNEPAENVACKV